MHNRWIRFMLPGLLALLLSAPLPAGNYRQTGYITNFRFVPELEQAGEDADSAPFNQLKAGDPAVVAYLLMDLVLDAGEHRLQVELLDREGELFDRLLFEDVQAAEDDWRYAVSGRFGGELPEGGLFFKVYDSLNDRPMEVIGTFRLLTASW